MDEKKKTLRQLIKAYEEAAAEKREAEAHINEVHDRVCKIRRQIATETNMRRCLVILESGRAAILHFDGMPERDGMRITYFGVDGIEEIRPMAA